MGEDGIVIKGNKEGLNIVINMSKYRNFEDMLRLLLEKMSKGKRFYKGSNLKITIDLKLINENEIIKLKDSLINEYLISECIFSDLSEKEIKYFTGIYEGRTKFIRRTIRSGQCIDYSGNIVIIGDVNPGAEVNASGNVIVIGNLKGNVHAGIGGNDKALIAAFSLQPEIIRIAELVSRSPDDGEIPQYPEVAEPAQRSELRHRQQAVPTRLANFLYF